jgi:hypothetical protein
MAQPGLPQLRKYPYVPALTLRANMRYRALARNERGRQLIRWRRPYFIGPEPFLGIPTLLDHQIVAAEHSGPNSLDVHDGQRVAFGQWWTHTDMSGRYAVGDGF